jgi:hypothetical protein
MHGGVNVMEKAGKGVLQIDQKLSTINRLSISVILRRPHRAAGNLSGDWIQNPFLMRFPAAFWKRREMSHCKKGGGILAQETVLNND